jgi:peptidoglycan/xylan/chitin deacetylase (PgdA/CDA1 family)
LLTRRAKIALLNAIAWPAWAVRRVLPGAGRVPVLCYHRVLPDLREAGSPVFTLTPDQFEAQMAWLRREGVRSLSLDEYGAMARGEADVPERAVLVTFDDGYADNYHVAWPLARRYGVKLNLFLCTGLVSGEVARTYETTNPGLFASQAAHPELWRPLTWVQAREMREGGVGFGLHSHTHGNHGRMTAAEVRCEIERGLSLFTRELGIRPTAFAFPGGSFGTYTDETVRLLTEYGFTLLFTTRLGRTRVAAGGPLISRLVVYQEDSLPAWRRKLAGACDWLGSLREFDQAWRAARGAQGTSRAGF